MTYKEILDLINLNLASRSKIQAVKHREVETALLDFTQSNVAQQYDIKAIYANSTYLGNGIRSTKYQYTIDDAFIPYTNRTNQGIDSIFNLNAGDKYSNLRYSVARNIKNFWNSYLATCNLYWKDTTIKNTWYKNNGECTTSIGGVILKEKDDILPSNPIVTPFMYSNVTFKGIDFVDFINLQNAIRTQRGFIRFIDNNRRVVKLYPTEVEYSLLEKAISHKYRFKLFLSFYV